MLIGRHTADALVAAHDQGIVHRDLKPQNLLIDAYGRIKLCDFGIASLARSDDFQTAHQRPPSRYASPEDLDEEAEVGPASDVYSLGATLVHLVHGTPLAVKDRLQPWGAPPTDDVELAAVDGVIEQCLQTDPERRPTSAEVLDQLEAIDWTPRRPLPLAPGRTAAALLRQVPTTTTPSHGSCIGAGRASRRRPRRGRRAVAGRRCRGRRPSRSDHRTRGRLDPVVRRRSPRQLRGVPTPIARPGRIAVPRSARADPPRRRWPWIAGALLVAASVGVGAALLWPGMTRRTTARQTGPTRLLPR